jgi:hypothetical protein
MHTIIATDSETLHAQVVSAKEFHAHDRFRRSETLHAQSVSSRFNFDGAKRSTLHPFRFSTLIVRVVCCGAAHKKLNRSLRVLH